MPDLGVIHRFLDGNYPTGPRLPSKRAESAVGLNDKSTLAEHSEILIGAL